MLDPSGSDQRSSRPAWQPPEHRGQSHAVGNRNHRQSCAASATVNHEPCYYSIWRGVVACSQGKEEREDQSNGGGDGQGALGRVGDVASEDEETLGSDLPRRLTIMGAQQE